MAEEIREQYAPDAERLINDGMVELYEKKDKQYNGQYAGVISAGIEAIKGQNEGQLPSSAQMQQAMASGEVNQFNYNKGTTEVYEAFAAGLEAFEKEDARLDEKMEARKATLVVNKAKELVGR